MKFSAYNTNDIEEIKKLFIKTFSDSEGEEEGLLIGDLAYNLITTTRASDFYCFVASNNKQIIGSLIFSKLTFERDIKAFLLGPVATHTDYQGKGIGKNLIDFGIDILKEDGAELAFTYGDINFYSKVGFSLIDEKLIKAPFKLTYPEGWLAQSLVCDEIKSIAGNSYCVKAINNPKYW